MFVSFYLVVFICTILHSSHHVSSKRGCASFGHSCFGGHGKRSQTGDVIIPAEMLANTDASKHNVLSEQDDLSSFDRLPYAYDSSGKRDADVKSLLKKLVRSYEEKQRLYKNQIPKYFNY